VGQTRATISDHNTHQIQSQNEPKDQLIAKLQVELTLTKKMLPVIWQLTTQQRNSLLKRLDTYTTLKNPSRTENQTFILFETTNKLAKLTSNPSATENLINVHNLHSTVNMEKWQLQLRHQKMHLQFQLNELVRNSTMIFNFQPLKRPLRNTRHSKGNSHFRPLSHQNQVPFRANSRKSLLWSWRDLTDQTVNSSYDHHNHNTILDSQQHSVHNTRKKSHHEKNLLMQNVDISADCRCHNRTQLFNNVNHDPQNLVFITTKNTRSSLNCGVRRNHNMIQPLKYVNDHPQNLVFVKLQNTRSSSASTWWRPRTDGRSHYVDRLRPDNNHQPPTTPSGGG
jgi:hypothetical protein